MRTSRFLRRLVMFVLMLGIVPVSACNLSESATPTATPAPPPAAATVPLLGLNPVMGAPGTTITLNGSGFPPGVPLNLFLSPFGASSNAPYSALTAGPNGVVTFALLLPTQLGGVTLSDNTPILFTVSAGSGQSASALFLAQPSGQASGTLIPTQAPSTGGTGSTGGGTVNVFIISPASGSVLGGTTVVVTGSAPTGSVVVQVEDVNNNVLGSATVASVASGGTLGVWQTTISFNQPASGGDGYIVATESGLQASIPVSFPGGGALQSVTPLQFQIMTATPFGTTG